jgi:hypothetical protein
MNEPFLRAVGADTILGGEYEAGLVSLVQRLRASPTALALAPQPEPLISLAKQEF